MNKTQVIDLLKASADPQRTARINPVGNLKSFGIGLTELRKLAKKLVEIMPLPANCGAAMYSRPELSAC